jgi:hypothetical protein
LLNKQRTDEDWLGITFVAFDAPALNVTFKQRLESMETVFNLNDSLFIKLQIFEVCKDSEALYKKLDEITAQGKFS